MGEKLEFDVVVGKNDLNKTLKEAEGYASTMSSYFASGLRPEIKEVTKEASLFKEELASISSAGSYFTPVTAGIAAITAGIATLTSMTSSAINEFSENEDAVNKLNQALKASGSFSESASDGFQAFADQMAVTTKNGGEAVLSQLAFAKSLGATNDQAKELVKAGANLAATFGGTLEERVDQLGKTFSGSAGKLAVYIPELKELTKEQLAAGAAADIVNKKFSGAATSELDTHSGSVAALGESYSQLEETLGEAIVKSEIYKRITGSIKEAIDATNASIKASAIVQEEQNRVQGTGAKTAEQLGIEFEVLRKRSEDLKSSIQDEEASNGGFLQFFLGSNIGLIKENLKEVEAEMSKIEEKLLTPKLSLPREATETIKPPVDLSTDAEVESAKKRNADILAIDQQLYLERYNARVEAENLKIEDELTRNQAEIQRMYDFDVQKKEVEAQQKIDSAQATLDGEALRQETLKIQKEKQLALLQLYNKKETDMTKAASAENIKIKKYESDEQIRFLGYVSQQTAASFALGAALAKDGSKTQFAINKAAAVAQVLVARETGIANALMLPPPAQPAAIFNANMIAGLSLATIAATAIKGYADGGVIGGFGNGATGGGDNTVSATREGEMYLNGQQQKFLFDFITKGGGGGGDIVVKIDEREIARAVRNQKEAGFVL